MTPEQIARVFGRGRLKMVTGEHVEVFREAVAPGERRRYTKRFLNTREGDFGQWTEREWRILARLIGHGVTCVPEVVQFDRGFIGGSRIVQTYDAGVTVDQWATLLPVARDGRMHRHVFEDCAHWWALAHHCLAALEEIHRLELVHLDVKGDNVCIPYAPASFDPHSGEASLRPVFAQFALIDFAFALVSRDSLITALPIGWQKEYDYQSPRLLAALEAGRNGDLQQTRDLDWRCDMYSLAAMLKRYLPDGRDDRLGATGWTPARYDAAKALIFSIRAAHDAELAPRRPHAALMEVTNAQLREPELAHSLERGWALARAAETAPASPLTPVTQLVPITRIATPIQVTRSGRTAVTAIAPLAPTAATAVTAPAIASTGIMPPARAVRRQRPSLAARAVLATLTLLAVAAAGALLYRNERLGVFGDDRQALFAPLPATARSADPPALRSDAPSATAVEPAAPSRHEPGRDASSAAAATVSRTIAGDAARVPSRESIAAAPSARVATTPNSMPAGHSLRPMPSFSPSVASAAPERALPPLPSYRDQASETLRPSHAGSHGRPATPSASAPSVPERAVTPQRSYAPWASLQPPTWLKSRNHSPGEPPGYKAHQEGQLVASTEASAVKPIEAPPQEPAAQGVQPASVAPSTVPAIPSVPVAAAGQGPQGAALAVAAPMGETGAAAQPGATRLAKDSQANTATGRSLFASRSVAPVEDRSRNLSLALAPATVAAAATLPRAVMPPDEHRADDVASQAHRVLSDTVPRGEAEVSRVLLIAASAYRPTQDQAVADAARVTRIRDDTSLPNVRASATVEARRLHNQARAVFASGRNVHEALDLQLRAFSANPRDPEIAGYLAVLYLKTTPPQPDLARQAALMALTARSSQYATTRMEDWQTFAVASALAGRDTDAKNALLVTLALSNNVERTCVAGWNALANYGDRMRGPLDAMLYRVYMRGHSVDSPWCAYPPDFSTPPRLAGDVHY